MQTVGMNYDVKPEYVTMDMLEGMPSHKVYEETGGL